MIQHHISKTNFLFTVIQGFGNCLQKQRLRENCGWSIFVKLLMSTLVEKLTSTNLQRHTSSFKSQKMVDLWLSTRLKSPISNLIKTASKHTKAKLYNSMKLRQKAIWWRELKTASYSINRTSIEDTIKSISRIRLLWSEKYMLMIGHTRQ